VFFTSSRKCASFLILISSVFVFMLERGYFLVFYLYKTNIDQSTYTHTMNWTHPFMLLVYALLILIFLSFVANRSKQTFKGPDAAKYYMNQAKSAMWGASYGKPSLDLINKACGLIYVKAARKLCTDTEIQRQSGVDPVELQTNLLQCTDLQASFGITPDEFRTLLA